MAAPAPKPPTGNTNDEALEILRRLEPVLARMSSDLNAVKTDLNAVKTDLNTVRTEQARQADVLVRLDERQRKQGEDLARLDGRVSQLPTLYQLAGLIFAIFGASFVLIHFAAGH
jgi:small-conductance mechanosensitive channel